MSHLLDHQGLRDNEAGDRVFSRDNSVRHAVLIGWKAAPSYFVIVNTDGPVLQPDSVASAGGVIWNSNGKVLHSFAANRGRCNVTRAKLHGAIFGFRLAWDRRYCKVNLLLDS
ncbi:Putative ribonuclease H protein At1g65750 [Linum grandiflorum]